MIDDRTQYLNLPLPHQENQLVIDVNRLRASLSDIDAYLAMVSESLAAAVPTAARGAADGVCPLDAQGRVPTTHLPEVLFGGVTYQDRWDASTNTPTIPAASADNKGHYYLVSVAGSTTIDGESGWVQGDWIVSNGTTWGRIANSEVFDATAIQSGTFNSARIPQLDIAKINSLQAALDAKFSTAGGALTGQLSSASINAVMAQNDATSSIEVRNGAGAGDTGLAALGFHCQGTYAAKLGLRSDGYFGFGGWSRPAWQFYSASNGDFIAAGNVGAYSDPRLKDNVQSIDGALGIIEQLRGVRFTWNERTELVGRPGERDIGVLADEVEAVLPEIVGRSMPDEANGGEQWRVVAYDKLVPVLIEAVKELSARVKELEGR